MFSVLPKDLVELVVSFASWDLLYRLHHGSSNNGYWKRVYNEQYQARKKTLEFVLVAIKYQDHDMLDRISMDRSSFLGPTEICIMAINLGKKKVANYYLETQPVADDYLFANVLIPKLISTIDPDILIDWLQTTDMAYRYRFLHDFIRMIVAGNSSALHLLECIGDNSFGNRWETRFDQVFDSNSWVHDSKPEYWVRRYHSSRRIQHYFTKLKEVEFVNTMVCSNKSEIRIIVDDCLRVNGQYIGDRRLLLTTAIDSNNLDRIIDIVELEIGFTSQEYLDVINSYRSRFNHIAELLMDELVDKFLQFECFQQDSKLLVYRYQHYNSHQRRDGHLHYGIDVMDIWNFVDKVIEILGYLPRVSYQSLMDEMITCNDLTAARHLSYYQVDLKQG